MQLRKIKFHYILLFLFCSAFYFHSFSQDQTLITSLSLDDFPVSNFEPDLKTSLRAPDRWELALNIEADNKEVQSLIMNFYRDNNYSELQWLNLWHSRCAGIWSSIADSCHLPNSASYIPIMIERSNLEKCSCINSGAVLSEFVGLENESTKFISKLEEVFKKSEQEDEDFGVWLHEFRIIIRLLENFVLPDYKAFWANNEGVKKRHLVLKGETLYRLSIKYNVSVEDIQSINGLGRSTDISEGSSLIIPSEK